MKKFLVTLFLAFVSLLLIADIPTKINTLQMPNKTTPFGGNGYQINQRVELLDSNLSWRLTHAVTSSQTMATVFSNHWYLVIGGSGSSVRGDSLQYVVNDTVARNAFTHKKVGMLVYVRKDSTIYQLLPFLQTDSIFRDTTYSYLKRIDTTTRSMYVKVGRYCPSTVHYDTMVYTTNSLCDCNHYVTNSGVYPSFQPVCDSVHYYTDGSCWTRKYGCWMTYTFDSVFRDTTIYHIFVKIDSSLIISNQGWVRQMDNYGQIFTKHRLFMSVNINTDAIPWVYDTVWGTCIVQIDTTKTLVLGGKAPAWADGLPEDVSDPYQPAGFWSVVSAAPHYFEKKIKVHGSVRTGVSDLDPTASEMILGYVPGGSSDETKAPIFFYQPNGHDTAIFIIGRGGFNWSLMFDGWYGDFAIGEGASKKELDIYCDAPHKHMLLNDSVDIKYRLKLDKKIVKSGAADSCLMRDPADSIVKMRALPSAIDISGKKSSDDTIGTIGYATRNYTQRTFEPKLPTSSDTMKLLKWNHDMGYLWYGSIKGTPLTWIGGENNLWEMSQGLQIDKSLNVLGGSSIHGSQYYYGIGAWATPDSGLFLYNGQLVKLKWYLPIYNKDSALKYVTPYHLLTATANGNTAFSWGNWSHTTLSGYGITDACPLTGSTSLVTAGKLHTTKITSDSSIVAGVVSLGNSGTAKTVYATQGNTFTVTRTGNCTFTIVGMIAGQTLTLSMYHEASSTAYSVTISPALVYTGGTAPTYTNTSGGHDVLVIKYDGITYMGMQSADWKTP